MAHSTHDPGVPDLPRWLWFGVPAAIYPLLLLSIVVAPDFYRFMMRKEGAIEYLAVGFLLVGIGFGVAMLIRYRAALPHRWLVGWFGFVAFAMFMFAGEEISWGQHLGLWGEAQVPEAIKAINDQNETNLHNISNALDQGPTNAIVLLTFIAFIANPLYLRLRGETMATDNPGYWFWPTRVCLIAAIGVLFIPFPMRIYEGMQAIGWLGPNGPGDNWRHSELHEFYVALLMTLYMISAYRRARALHLDSISQPTPAAAMVTGPGGSQRPSRRRRQSHAGHPGTA
jgi:hypothetical protein